jgi:hypothetical protein
LDELGVALESIPVAGVAGPRGQGGLVRDRNKLERTAC